MRTNSAIHPEAPYVPDSPTNNSSIGIGVLSRLQRVWQFITDSLSHPSELEVRETYDRSGNLWWYVYDPKTGRSAWLDSEDEVRIWIEKNY